MSVAKENVFGQLQLNWIDQEKAIFKRSQNLTKLVLLGPYLQNIARFIFLEFLESVCGPGKLKCTFKSNIECFIF